MEHRFYSEDNVASWTEVQRQLWRVYQTDLNLFFLYFPNPFAHLKGASPKHLIDDLLPLLHSFFISSTPELNVVSGNWGLISLLMPYSDFAGD
jgi:hypothetical protein